MDPLGNLGQGDRDEAIQACGYRFRAERCGLYRIGTQVLMVLRSSRF